MTVTNESMIFFSSRYLFGVRVSDPHLTGVAAADNSVTQKLFCCLSGKNLILGQEASHSINYFY